MGPPRSHRGVRDGALRNIECVGHSGQGDGHGVRGDSNLTSLKLVRTQIVVDAVEGVAEVVVEGVGGGDDVGSGLDFDGLVAAGGLNELAD